MRMRRFRVIGPGRAGTSLHAALGAAAGWDARPMLGRGAAVSGAAAGVDLLVIATPDRAIAEVAAAVEPGDAVVAHLSGACGLDVLAPHHRRAAMHPLMTLPNEALGAQRLLGAWFAVSGDDLVHEVVSALAGRPFVIEESHRATYHAAACVASNHLVALLAQVERLAAAANVPFAAFFDIARASVDNVEALGPRAALTGPAARGDLATIERHRAGLRAQELPLYDALVDEIRRFVS